MINGVINVYKERGFTSHDVVAKLRGILHQKKIGHTGTLDPDAVGVLPVCLGNGTRLCDMLTDTDKIYETQMILGMRTDTQDTSGQLLEECAARLTEEKIRDAVWSFVGDYDQIPPMYSALKVHGKKLYELAREGKEVERPARRVHIYDIHIQRIDVLDSRKDFILSETGDLPAIPLKPEPEIFPKMAVTMEVTCSKGTYIRTLCEDIGRTLGTGGCMSALKRTRTGIFCAERAVTLDEIQKAAANQCVEQFVVPVDAMFSQFPGLSVNENGERLLYNGNPVKIEDFCEIPVGLADGTSVRVYDQSGAFKGIYQYCEKLREFKVVKMFL